MQFESEMQRLKRLATRVGGQNDGVYDQAEVDHDHAFLPRLIANGLAAELAYTLGNACLLPEYTDEGSAVGVLHAGSIKLALYDNYEEKGRPQFVIQTLTAVVREGNAEGVSLFFFHNPTGDLLVEFTAMVGHGNSEPKRFELSLPNTRLHPLNVMLGELRPIVAGIFKNGVPMSMHFPDLKAWTARNSAE